MKNRKVRKRNIVSGILNNSQKLFWINKLNALIIKELLYCYVKSKP